MWRRRSQPIPSHPFRCCYHGNFLDILVHPGSPCDGGEGDWLSGRLSRVDFPKPDDSIGSGLLDSPRNCYRNWPRCCNQGMHGADNACCFYHDFCANRRDCLVLYLEMDYKLMVLFVICSYSLYLILCCRANVVKRRVCIFLHYRFGFLARWVKTLINIEVFLIVYKL